MVFTSDKRKEKRKFRVPYLYAVNNSPSTQYKKGKHLVGKTHQKSILDLIDECRHRSTEKEVISCLKELFEKTNNGLVSYELGHEYEKLGNNKDAINYYEKAEALFEKDSFKNMARAAINNIIIEGLIADKKKKKSK